MRDTFFLVSNFFVVSLTEIQIRTQLDSMNQIAANEMKKNKATIFINKDSEETCEVVRMKPNGSCMFAAILHQTNMGKSTEKSFPSSVIKFRKQIVEHIRQNSNKYVDAIKSTIWDSTIDVTEVTEADCANYLENQLTKQGFEGGYEVLQAASVMLRTNILVIDEQNGAIMLNNSFDVDYDKTIILAYKVNNRAARSGEHTYKHYASVYQIEVAYLDRLIEQLKQSTSNFIFLYTYILHIMYFFLSY